MDSSALIVSDYSNGNDGVLMKGKGKQIADLKGQQVNLVQFSVSHYLLARALDSAHMSERDLKVVNTSDADISKIPGEIMDMMVVNTKALQENPALGKALTGAWFEMVALMHGNSPDTTTALTTMDKASGTDLANFKGQL
ncbi:hypothetical protein AWB79_06800 [Caballeronia hypogeia]|uniref:SsuA/THI5-like domain-containing protein n=1 Tax=Caballeronia hypogeia TaxID=1777140 RepID=A0A158DES2_9BURK|nr:hypothetical protein AWB79_06800 [Caballeronia hypogeia]